MYTKINNPGGGHCGFYSFAIGALYLIVVQEGTRSPLYQRWLELDPSIQTELDSFLARCFQPVEFSRVCQEDHYRVVQPFKDSIKRILQRDAAADLQRTVTEHYAQRQRIHSDKSFVYLHFVDLVQHIDAGVSLLHNVCAISVALKNLARFIKTQLQGIQNDILRDELQHLWVMRAIREQPALFQAVYQQQYDPQTRWWADDQDLIRLAKIFDVVIDVQKKIDGPSWRSQPCIYLENDSSNHWQTRIYPRDYAPQTQAAVAAASGAGAASDVGAKQKFDLVAKNQKYQARITTLGDSVVADGVTYAQVVQQYCAIGEQLSLCLDALDVDQQEINKLMLIRDTCDALLDHYEKMRLSIPPEFQSEFTRYNQDLLGYLVARFLLIQQLQQQAAISNESFLQQLNKQEEDWLAMQGRFREVLWQKISTISWPSRLEQYVGYGGGSGWPLSGSSPLSQRRGMFSDRPLSPSPWRDGLLSRPDLKLHRVQEYQATLWPVVIAMLALPLPTIIVLNTVPGLLAHIAATTALSALAANIVFPLLAAYLAVLLAVGYQLWDKSRFQQQARPRISLLT